MSTYEEGFQDGIEHFKFELLQWVDTYEDNDAELLVEFYHKLVERLEA